MFHFSGCCVLRSMNSIGDDPVLTGTGYPIRKSAGRGLFAAHRGLSQLITSFFACWHQGIHHALLVALYFFDIWKSLICAITVPTIVGRQLRRLSKLLKLHLICPVCGCQRACRGTGPRRLDACSVSEPATKFKTFMDFQQSWA